MLVFIPQIHAHVLHQGRLADQPAAFTSAPRKLRTRPAKTNRTHSTSATLRFSCMGLLTFVHAYMHCGTARLHMWMEIRIWLHKHMDKRRHSGRKKNTHCKHTHCQFGFLLEWSPLVDGGHCTNKLLEWKDITTVTLQAWTLAPSLYQSRWHVDALAPSKDLKLNSNWII